MGAERWPARAGDLARWRVLPPVLACLLALAGCGEPVIDVGVPPREPGQHVLDEAGILDDDGLQRRLRELSDAGLDVVAITYESEQANQGEARRAASAFVDAWGADVAMVAVAEPGAFPAPDRGARFFGIEPADPYEVPGGLREEIVEGTVPPIAATGDWPAVFRTAADELAAELLPGPGR